VNRNVSLDFFRGVFSIVVALGHFYFWNGMRDVVSSSFVLAVDFFFILSGFVLAKSILCDRRNDARWFFSFTEKRIYRIFPTFLFVIVCHFVFLKLTTGVPNPSGLDLFKILTLTQLFPFNDGSRFNVEPMRVGWSISGEFWIGIIFFTVLHALKNKNNGLIFSSFLFLSICLLVFISRTSPDHMNVHFHLWNGIPYGFVRVLIGFMLGACIALVSQPQSSNMAQSIIQITVITLICYLFVKIEWSRPDSYVAPFLFAVMIYSLSSRKGIVYWATNNSLGEFLGKISYPLYLVHPAFAVYARNHFDSLDIYSVLIYLAVIIPVSYAVHLFVEQRAIEFVSRRDRPIPTLS